MDRRMDRRALAKGAGAVASAAALGLFQTSAEASGAPETTRTGASLYDRLGGYFGIALVVNRFSDEILKKPDSQQEPCAQGVEQDGGGSAAAGSQVRSHAVDRSSGRRTL